MDTYILLRKTQSGLIKKTKEKIMSRQQIRLWLTLNDGPVQALLGLMAFACGLASVVVLGLYSPDFWWGKFLFLGFLIGAVVTIVLWGLLILIKELVSLSVCGTALSGTSITKDEGASRLYHTVRENDSIILLPVSWAWQLPQAIWLPDTERGEWTVRVEIDVPTEHAYVSVSLFVTFTLNGPFVASEVEAFKGDSPYRLEHYITGYIQGQAREWRGLKGVATRFASGEAEGALALQHFIASHLELEELPFSNVTRQLVKLGELDVSFKFDAS